MNPHDHPGAPLLDAVTRFLISDVHPLLDAPAEKGVAFRVLIAANLAAIGAAELRGGEARDREALQRLLQLLPTEAAALGLSALPDTGAAQRDALARLNQALAQLLREGALSPERAAQLTDHLQETLRADLALCNPRFALDDDIE